MENGNYWRGAFCRMLHVFTTFVEVQARKPLGHLLMEAVLIVVAIYLLQLIADTLSTL